jgi:hypothetical protein
MKRLSGVLAAMVVIGLGAAPAAAEQVYEITINHWAATNNQGEVEIRWSAKVNPTSTTRTSTSSGGVLCAGASTVWKWSTGQNPSIKQLASKADKASGTAMLKAQGTSTGQKPVKFSANMGVECGTAESNVVQKTINVVR